MSVLNKKPYIQSVVDALSTTQKSTFISLLDSDSTPTQMSWNNLPTSYGITKVLFTLDSQNVKNGYLVYTSTLTSLICYHRFQDLLIYKINYANHTFEKINEYCDINELRRVLGAGGASIDANDLAAKLAGQDGINTDVNEDGSKVNISFDSTINPWLITLSDSVTSGTITDTDYTKLAASRVALIKRGDTYYYKVEDSTTSMLYVSATTSKLKQILITKSTKAWAYSAVTVKTGASTGYHCVIGSSTYPLGGSTVLTIANGGIVRDSDFPVTFEDAYVGTNIFVKFPTFYRKINSIVDGQITSFTISTEKEDISYVPYSCFVDANGNVLPYVLMGKYMSKPVTDTSTGVLVSEVVADADAGNFAMAVGRSCATRNGLGYQLFDWQMQKLMQDLAVAVLGTTNTNDGTGFDVLLGMYNQKKGFWVDGVAKSTDDTWLFGTNPANYINSPTSSSTDYVEAYAAPTASDWIAKLGYQASMEFGNYPTTADVTGSDSTYYCDYYYYGSGDRPVYSYVGGTSSLNGVWACVAYGSWSTTVGVRLCYRPLSA